MMNPLHGFRTMSQCFALPISASLRRTPLLDRYAHSGFSSPLQTTKTIGRAWRPCFYWYPGGESNPHFRRNLILSQARLPIPPPGHPLKEERGVCLPAQLEASQIQLIEVSTINKSSFRKKAFEIESRAPQVLLPFLCVGPWRSLVARLSGGQEVPSSNLGGPTIFLFIMDSAFLA